MSADEAARAAPGEDVRRALRPWYAANGRHALPWRLTRDPYAVAVSEVMLQQTQVERVKPYYADWMARWPSVAALAGASAADVIRAWSGLGYNRRALHLHRLALAVAEHGWPEPPTVAGLRVLPGIGPYTASALFCFAWEERAAVVDTNIARVVARVMLGVARWKAAPAAEVARAAEELLPRDGARDHNLALMDLGAMVCTARAPRCDVCPLAAMCAWRLAGWPDGGVARTMAVAPFAETARFARGRIVEALREGPHTEHELRALLPQAHRARLGTYLRGLERDGLVVAEDGVWSLPGVPTGG